MKHFEHMHGVALLSYRCDTGVGLTGFDFYSHLPFARWVVVPHPRLGITARTQLAMLRPTAGT
jgi:hypothetical protein